MKRRTTLLALAGLAMSALSANAAILAFSTANGTVGPNTPPTLNSSYGDGVDVALNLGNSSGGTLAYDGITFTNNNVTSASNTVLWATVGGISVGATTNVGATWNVATNIVSGSSTYNSTFGTEAWANLSGGGNFQTINLTGLDAGRSYLIQLMHGEDRSIGNGFSYIGQLTATDSASNTANTTLQFGDDNDANTFIFGLVTLEVSGVTSVDINYPFRDALFPDAGVSDRDPSLAGIVISSEAIPEPSAALLSGLGLLGLLRRRRN
jgi:MYXO-CTERM domain-containing protein